MVTIRERKESNGMNNKIDFEKYGLHGEEQLVSAAVAGLYAMQVDGADCPQCDFQSLVSGGLTAGRSRQLQHCGGISERLRGLPSNYSCLMVSEIRK